MMMNMTKVAIQGYRGCFHEQAAREFYSARGEEISIVECPTFEGLCKAGRAGEAGAGEGDAPQAARASASSTLWLFRDRTSTT